MKRSSNQPLDGPHEEFFAGGELSAEGRLARRLVNRKTYDKSGALKRCKAFKSKR
jgi:hypothetical protein